MSNHQVNVNISGNMEGSNINIGDNSNQRINGKNNKPELKKWTTKLYQSIRLSLLWVELAVLFGLMQVWLVLLASYLLNEIQVTLLQMILEGALLFFSIAIIASITVDYTIGNYCLFEQRNCELRRKADLLLAPVLFSAVIPIFIGVFVYGISYSHQQLTLEAENKFIATYTVLFVYTLVFAFIIKLREYYTVQGKL